MKLRMVASMAVAALALAVSSGSALATGTLDQHQTNTSGYTIDWIPGVQLAQTFKAGLTGKLDSIDIHANGSGASVTVEVQTSNGLPTGTVLAKVSLKLNDTGWTHITLAKAPNVTAGGLYAIVITQFTDVGWSGDCSNGYSNGGAYVLDTGTWYTVPGWATHAGAPLSSYCARDYAFQTYVTKPAPTASPSVAATATATSSAEATPTSAVLGATAVPSQGTTGSGSSGSGGSTGIALPILAGGAVVLAAAIGLLGFLAGRRRHA